VVKRLNAVLILLGLGFLAYLVWSVGPAKLWLQVSALGWGVIPLILSEGAGNLAHTVGWRHCLNRSYPSIPLPRLFRMAMAGYAINYLTPSASVGGELSRAALLTSTQPAADAVSSVLLDKLMTALAHLLIAVVGSLFLLWQVKLPVQLWVAMAVTTGLMTGGMVIFLLLQKHGKVGAFFRWLADHHLGGQALQQTARRISEVDDSLKQFYGERPKDLLLSIGWHVVGHSAAFLQAWLFLRLLHQPAPLVTVAGAGFLALWFDLLTFAIPMNLGTLEGSRIVTFKALGCQALLGLTFGIAVRIAQVFWACFGLVSYSLFAAQSPGPPPALARSPTTEHPGSPQTTQ
jgi:glycosyltransferase 2 family protein